MPRLKPGTLVPTDEEDIIITTAAMDDPDARPFSDEEWADVKPVRDFERLLQAVTKTPISIGLDVRVLDALKAT
jgi:hypothetical protein